MILVIGGAFQGKRDFVKNKFGEAEVFENFHLKVRECMKNNGDVSELTANAVKYDIVISDEVGSGIIPLDKFDRDWRELVGRELCKIAAKADEVWRVNCGIGQRIK